MSEEVKNKVISFVKAYAEAYANTLNVMTQLEVALENVAKIEERPEADVLIDETGFSAEELDNLFLGEILNHLEEFKTCPYCHYKYTEKELLEMFRGKPDYHMLQHDLQHEYPRPKRLKKNSLAWVLAGFKPPKPRGRGG